MERRNRIALRRAPWPCLPRRSKQCESGHMNDVEITTCDLSLPVSVVRTAPILSRFILENG
jgi:hypothetical protein